MTTETDGVMSKNPPKPNTSPEHVKETAEAYTCPSHTEARERLLSQIAAGNDLTIGNWSVSLPLADWRALRTLLATPTQGEDISSSRDHAHTAGSPLDDVDAFLAEVRAELIRARAKFPGDRIMTIALAEEFGELCKAVPPAQGHIGIAQPLVQHMTERFLRWRLPENFNPDGGISFQRTHSENGPFGPQKYEPVGTNLFGYDQAEAMVRYMLEGWPSGGALNIIVEWYKGLPKRAREGISLANLHELSKTLSDGSASDRVTADAEPSAGRLGHIKPASNLSGEAG